MSAEDDEFSVSHEDPWRLTSCHTAKERIHGIQECHKVLLTLLAVESQQLLVTHTQVSSTPSGGRRGGV